MNSIKQVLKNELESKTLSAQKKQEILQHKQPKRKKWLPKFVAVCVAAIALFLVVTTNDQKAEPTLSTTAPLGSVDDAIIQFVNNEIAREASDFYNGDAYLMRLALEKNSRMFYEDSKLALSDRQVVSELLHYIQEASWQGVTADSLQPVSTIEELAILAPKVIDELKPQVTMPYKTIADEKKHQRNLYSYDNKAWINYVVVLALLLFALVKLARGKNWIIMACCIFLAVVVAYQPFGKSYQDVAAYDEYTLIEVIENGLKDMDVKVSGEPVLQYAATIHGTRSALLAYEDMKVLATFSFKKGQYVRETLMWHTENVFHDIAIDTVDEPTQPISTHGFTQGHDIAKIQVQSEAGYEQSIDITPNEPTIIFYKKPQELSEYSFLFFDEKGQRIH